MDYTISSKIFIPLHADTHNLDLKNILERTTHLCVAAHQDDIEIMAFHGINECFRNEDKYFTAIIVTDGNSSDRKGMYSNMSDEDFIEARKNEQKKAAVIGEYNAVIFLDYESSKIKDLSSNIVLHELLEILRITQPEIIYTHSPFDNHNTHIAVCIRLLETIKSLNPPPPLTKIYGCEVWGGLEWLPERRKIVLDVSSKPNIQRALLGVFDTQIARGKPFDDACIRRRKAYATFQDSHETDNYSEITYALDLLEIISDKTTVSEFCRLILDEFKSSKLKTLELFNEH